MAGKSNKGKNRKAAHGNSNSAETEPSSTAPLKDETKAVPLNDETKVVPLNEETKAVPLNDEAKSEESSNTETNGHVPCSEACCPQPDVVPSGNEKAENPAKQGEVHLYPISVKTQGGDKLELQLSPGDSVMDVRQFLLDAPETCFFTCYDLILRTKDGSVHQLEDYNEISEVEDITAGDCSLKMVAGDCC